MNLWIVREKIIQAKSKQHREEIRRYIRQQWEHQNYPLISNTFTNLWVIPHSQLQQYQDTINNMLESTQLQTMSEIDHSQLVTDLLYLILDLGIVVRVPLHFRKDANLQTATLVAHLGEYVTEQELIYWLPLMSEEQREIVYYGIDIQQVPQHRWTKNQSLWAIMLNDLYLQACFTSLPFLLESKMVFSGKQLDQLSTRFFQLLRSRCEHEFADSQDLKLLLLLIWKHINNCFPSDTLDKLQQLLGNWLRSSNRIVNKQCWFYLSQIQAQGHHKLQKEIIYNLLHCQKLSYEHEMCRFIHHYIRNQNILQGQQSMQGLYIHCQQHNNCKYAY